MQGGMVWSHHQSRLRDMVSRAVVSTVVPDPGMVGHGAASVGDDTTKTRIRPDMHAIHNDTFLHMRSPLNPHITADHRPSNLSVQTQRTLSDHRVVDPGAHERSHRPFG